MGLRLTDPTIRKLSPPAKGQQLVYDSEVTGFALRLMAPSRRNERGARAFLINYRNAEGRERRYTIGLWPAWSAEAARKEAKRLRQEIDRGMDPMEERHEHRVAPTVADLCDRFVDEWLPKKRKSTAHEYKAMIKRIVRPKLGKRKVSAVTYGDIDKIHRELRSTPYRANRVHSLMSKMFALSIKWGMRPDNPAVGIERYPEEKRNRYLTAGEMKRLSEALADYPEKRAAKVDPDAKNAKHLIAREREWGQKAADLVRLCLLTGCRRGEALSASWDQFDLDQGTWTKRAANTKQNKEHVAPLSEAAVKLLNDVREAAQKGEDGKPLSPFVFPGRSPDNHLSEIKDEWEAIRTAAKIPDVRLHDLRHTYASILASAGASLPMIGALLGHTQPTTTHRYAHLFDDPLRKLTDQVGHVVTGVKSAEIVKIKNG